jgi:hypothetical protein
LAIRIENRDVLFRTKAAVDAIKFTRTMIKKVARANRNQRAINAIPAVAEAVEMSAG